MGDLQAILDSTRFSERACHRVRREAREIAQRQRCWLSEPDDPSSNHRREHTPQHCPLTSM